MIGLTVRGALLMVYSEGGFFSLQIAIWIWGMIMALLVRWQAEGARDVRNGWIFPGLLASLGILAIGFVTQLFDFFTTATIYVIPLIATAWVLTCTSPKVPDHEEMRVTD